MDNKIAIFIWSALILGSIFWYGFLVFYVGYKGGVEIKEMTDVLSKRNSDSSQKDNES